MPNRILREGIIKSPRMAALVKDAGWFGEVFYRRLISVVDDYGRHNADPELLRPELFPRQLTTVRETDISRLLAACEKAGLLRLYKGVNKGEPLLELKDFRQQTRSESKWDPPPAGDAQQMHSSCAADAKQVHTLDGDVGGDGDGGEGALSGGGGFEEFWKLFPPGGRKADKAGCRKVWTSRGLHTLAPTVMAGLTRWKRSREWAKGGGQFVPAPIVWLRQSRWEADPPAAGGADDFTDAGLSTGSELTNDDLRRLAAEVAGAA